MGARVLVIGGGGREHALVWALGRSAQVSELYCAPGNVGMDERVTRLALEASDVPGIVAWANTHRPDLVVIGPEGPLCAGLADALVAQGIAVFGPTKAAAELEGSKAFAKEIMRKAGVPTADFLVASDMAAVRAYTREHPGPLVVKADGLCAGKGVVVCKNGDEVCAAAAQMIDARMFGDAGARVVVEEKLVGREVSVMALCDGERVALLPAACDHKTVWDGDQGPNTGGMGTYSPTPRFDAALSERVTQEVLLPIVRAMAAADRRYRGVLYAGLMLTARGPFVLEFNCRFGDPETQVVLPRIAEDLYPWLLGAATGRLPATEIRTRSQAAVCVVQCAKGYPGSYERGAVISGLEEAASRADTMVFHAGTTRNASGRIVTSGGRVLGTTALGETLDDARARAYAAVQTITFTGEHHRTDIARNL